VKWCSVHDTDVSRWPAAHRAGYITSTPGPWWGGDGGVPQRDRSKIENSKTRVSGGRTQRVAC